MRLSAEITKHLLGVDITLGDVSSKYQHMAPMYLLTITEADFYTFHCLNFCTCKLMSSFSKAPGTDFFLKTKHAFFLSILEEDTPKEHCKVSVHVQVTDLDELL